MSNTKILVVLIVTVFVLSGCLPCCVPGRKKLKAADTAGEAESDWKHSEIYVIVDAGKSVSDDKLQETIRKVGFTPGKIERHVGKEKGNR